MPSSVFVSYSKKDSEFAYKLVDDLIDAGFSVWIDRSIGGGDDWRATIEKNLKAAKKVIIVVSPNSMASEWVHHEGSLAYGWGKKLCPILIAPFEQLPPWLEEYQYIDFYGIPYEAAINKLISNLAPKNPLIVHQKLISIILLISLLILALVKPTINYWLRFQTRNLVELAKIPASIQIPLGDTSLYEQGFALPEQYYDLPAFKIETTEVTIERLRLCHKAGVCETDSTYADEELSNARLMEPARYVTAKQANAFCTWIGRRLPTRYEWERAARYIDGRPWPWKGPLPEKTDPNRYQFANIDFELDGKADIGILQVGQTHRGKSVEDVYDLIGNVWEWSCTPSDQAPDFCTQNPQSMPVNEGPILAIHGGSVETTIIESSAEHQIINSLTYTSEFFGFRCVEDR